MKKRSLKTQLSLTIVLVSLITVALISLLSNFLINLKFKDYVKNQNKEYASELKSAINGFYDPDTGEWDYNMIHAKGMTALYDGYIMKVYDNSEHKIWDAEDCDSNLCDQVMMDITKSMKEKYHNVQGAFVSNNYDLNQNGKKIGSITISYYGPFFFNEGDFRFLSALNTILVGVGIFSLIFSIIIGWLLARKISRPITKTIDITREIAEGNYDISFEGTTKMHELDELAHSINHLAGSLNEQERLRKQLTADVSHELRTPLTSVSTHLEAMTEGLWEPTKDRLKGCMEEIDRMTKIVKDLERLAEVESDNLRLNKTSVNIADIISNVIKNFEMELNNKNLEINFSGEAGNILVDKDRITQVVVNLISNAIKYTPDNGKITIQLSQTENEVILNVQDNGIGIDSGDLPFIFERFYRADKSRNRKTGGAGIGLAIVKSVVKAHNGSIEVSSNIDEGSCFTVKLPKK